MNSVRKAALLWSGGKDSALALAHARQDFPDLDIGCLVTCLSQAFDRVSMHGVRRQLIEAQAKSIGLPIRFVVIPSPTSPDCPMTHSTPGTTFPPNDVYSTAILAAFAQLKSDGIETVIFGDIFLEDLRAYREKLLSHAGLTGIYPLWGRDSDELYHEFVTQGFQAITVCIDTGRLNEQHLGRHLDTEFRASLPAECDPCGERGEYHSYTFAGPIFATPVPFTVGAIHHQPPFAFQELSSS